MTTLTDKQLWQLREQAQRLKDATAEGDPLPVDTALTVIATSLVILAATNADALAQILAALNELKASQHTDPPSGQTRAPGTPDPTRHRQKGANHDQD